MRSEPNTRVLTAAFSVLLGNSVAAGLMALANILLLRGMDASQFAGYTIALSIALMSYRAFTVPICHAFLIEKGPDSPQLNLATVGLASVVVSVALATSISSVASHSTITVGAIALLSASLAAFEVIRTGHQKEHRFRTYGLADVLRTAFFLLATCVLWHWHSLTASAVLVIQSVAALIAAGFLCWTAPQIPIWAASYRNMQFVFKMACSYPYGYLFVYFAFGALLGQIEFLLLGALSNQTQIATYGAGYRIYQILALALGSVLSVLLPVTQRANSTAEVVQIFNQHIKHALVFAVICLHMAMTSPTWLPAFDGGKYPEGSTVFRILSASAALSFLCSPFVSHIMRERDFRFLATRVVLSVSAAALAGVLLVPPLGALGASLCMFLGNAALNGSIFLRSFRQLCC